MNNTRDTMGELRRQISGSDTFMSGHQIKKIRGRTRRVPAWTKDNTKVARLLLRSFPRLATDKRQRDRAARWTRIIHLYFRMQIAKGQIADELKMTKNAVKCTIKAIYRCAKGRTANNTKVRKIVTPSALLIEGEAKPNRNPAARLKLKGVENSPLILKDL